MAPPPYTSPGSYKAPPDCSGSLPLRDDRLPTALHGCAALSHIMAPPRCIAHGHTSNMQLRSADAPLLQVSCPLVQSKSHTLEHGAATAHKHSTASHPAHLGKTH